MANMGENSARAEWGHHRLLGYLAYHVHTRTRMHAHPGMQSRNSPEEKMKGGAGCTTLSMA